MIPETLSRAATLLGEDGLYKLNNSRVLIFGLGGVGSYTAEAIARAGVGAIELVDSDTVSLSNRNRQLAALSSTLGLLKTEAMAARIRDINPDCAVTARDVFLSEETADSFDFAAFDYVVDAIDTVSAKLLIAERCFSLGVPVISCMGTGNKLDPTRFRVSDIYATSVCPLARVMRRELKKRGVTRLKVVYSEEEPRPSGARGEDGRNVPGSVSFVPPVAGMILAGEVIKGITGVA